MRRSRLLFVAAILLFPFGQPRHARAEEPKEAAERLIQDVLWRESDDPERPEAIWRLTASDFSTSDAFLAQALANDENARRFNWHAPELILAVARLDRERRDIALRRHVLPFVDQPVSSTPVGEARARLAAGLAESETDPVVIGFIVRTLCELIALAPELSWEPESAVECMRTLPCRLRSEDAQAARDRILAACAADPGELAGFGPHDNRQWFLVEALRVLLSKLPVDGPGVDLDAWIPALDAVTDRRQFEPVLRALLDRLERLPESDQPEAAAPLLDVVLSRGVAMSLVDEAGLQSPMPGRGTDLYRSSKGRTGTLEGLARCCSEEARERARQ